MTGGATAALQTTTDIGVGDLVLAAQMSRKSFYSVFGSGGADMFFYTILHCDADEWEIGTGHMRDAATLARDTIMLSSNNDARVDFSAGEKTVINDCKAKRRSGVSFNVEGLINATKI